MVAELAVDDVVKEEVLLVVDDVVEKEVLLAVVVVAEPGPA